MVFNTRVNVYFQGNRKCSFLPSCACLYLYSIVLLISCALQINDDDDDKLWWTLRINNSGLP